MWYCHRLKNVFVVLGNIYNLFYVTLYLLFVIYYFDLQNVLNGNRRHQIIHVQQYRFHFTTNISFKLSLKFQSIVGGNCYGTNISVVSYPILFSFDPVPEQHHVMMTV